MFNSLFFNKNTKQRNDLMDFSLTQNNQEKNKRERERNREMGKKFFLNKLQMKRKHLQRKIMQFSYFISSNNQAITEIIFSLFFCLFVCVCMLL